MSALHTAEPAHRTCVPPQVGELWSLHGKDGHAIYLGGGLWNVLARVNDEYTLHQVAGLVPRSRPETQPAGFHWADQFDALAAADGLTITWADEVLAYQAQGWNKVRPLRGR